MEDHRATKSCKRLSLNDIFGHTNTHISTFYGAAHGVQYLCAFSEHFCVSWGKTEIKSRFSFVFFCTLSGRVYLCMKSLFCAAAGRLGVPLKGGREEAANMTSRRAMRVVIKLMHSSLQYLTRTLLCCAIFSIFHTLQPLRLPQVFTAHA